MSLYFTDEELRDKELNLPEEIIKEASQYFGSIYNKLEEDTEFLPTKNTNCFFCSFSKNGVCPLFKPRNEVVI